MSEDELVHPLDGVRVVDLSTGIAGAYCTKLLADGGADVVKVEDLDGDPLRRRRVTAGDADSVLFRYLAASKRSVAVDIANHADRQLVAALLREADIVVWSRGSTVAGDRDFAPAQVRALAPRAIVTAITPWGLDGPWADRPATEATLQAMAGAPMTRGNPANPPTIMGGAIGDYVAGMMATVGLLTARWQSLPTGDGSLVDVSEYESLLLTMTMYSVTFASIAGRPMRSNRLMNLPAIHQAKDGYVGFMVVTGQQWLDFCLLVEHVEWMDDESLLRFDVRNSRRDELVGAIDRWVGERTCDDVVDAATLLRIPVAKVENGASALDSEHFRARNFFIENPGGFVQPDVPYTLSNGAGRRRPGAAPRLGEHTAAVRGEARQEHEAITAASASGALPFEGLRVADFTANWAGPVVGHVLALFGADVIHVESVKRPDNMRFNTIKPMSEPRWWEWSPLFHGPNSGKRDVTLEMSDRRGIDLARRLIAASDIVIENNSPRVFEQWNLDDEQIRAINPGAIVVRAPAFGLSGPWRDRTGYAQTMEMASGLAWMTGQADQPPEIPNGPMDPIAGTHATIALLLALEYRRRTGRGMLVESPMIGGALNVAGELFVEYSANGVILHRNGNRSPDAAPQGCYESADTLPGTGDQRFVFVSVASDEQWRSLCGLLDRPAWATDPRLDTLDGRQAAHDELDARLADWCATQPADALVDRLIAVGVPAAKVLMQHEPGDIAQLAARRFWEEVEHPDTGTNTFMGYPARLDNGPSTLNRGPAPTLGRDNHAVLVDLLGVSEAEYAELEADGVIGSAPSGANTAW